MTVHRIWDLDSSDQAGIIWFYKNPDGSASVLRTFASVGKPLAHYVSIVLHQGIDAGSVDYVRPDAHVKYSGVSVFDAMKTFGLNPEVLPTPAWRSATPFAEASA